MVVFDHEMMALVTFALVTSWTRDPETGRWAGSDHVMRRSATSSRGVQSSKLAFGIASRLVAVSKQVGRIAKGLSSVS